MLDLLIDCLLGGLGAALVGGGVCTLLLAFRKPLVVTIYRSKDGHFRWVSTDSLGVRFELETVEEPKREKWPSVVTIRTDNEGRIRHVLAAPRSFAIVTDQDQAVSDAFDALALQTTEEPEVVECREHPGCWRVESSGPDGECYGAEFWGPAAKEWAEWYARHLKHL